MNRSKSKIIQSKILCVAVLSFSAMTACKSAAVGDGASGSTANSAVNAADSKSGATSADSKTAISDALKNLQNAQSWVAEAETSNDVAPQADVKMQIKYSAPDSFQIENNAAGDKMQIVAVGGKTYIQTGGKWQAAPPSVNMGQMINNWKDMFSDQRLGAFKNIESAGRETVDGRELAIYTYEIDQEKAMPEEAKKQMTDEMKQRIAEMQSESRAKLWIDESKNLPARLEMTMKMSQPQPMTQKMAIKYIYDQPVNIEVPKLK